MKSGEMLIEAAKQMAEIAKPVPASIEAEIASLRVIVMELEKMDRETRIRTLRYLWNHYT